jgi:carboxyl-terminal processing protease
MSPLFPLSLDAAFKGTLLLLGAYALGQCMKRLSAGGRHLLWTMTMLGLLAIPILSWSLPAWQFPVTIPAQAQTHFVAEVNRGRVALIVLDQALKPVNPPQAEKPPANPGMVLVANRGATSARDFPTVQSKRTFRRVLGSVSVSDWIVRIWLGGAVLSLAWLGAGWLCLGRLTKSCRRVEDGPLAAILQDVAQTLGIRPPVLLLSPSRSIPMTWGVMRPKVLLPEDALSWNESKLRMVLVHELGHILRRDSLAQLLGNLARGLYWFHPLVWFAVRRLHLEQEQACDDLVLDSGVCPPDYAEQLLGVTAGLPASFWTAPAAVGMGRTEKLRRRIESLLDSARNHRPVGRRSRLLALAVAAVLVVPLASAGFTGEPVDDPEQVQPTIADKENALLKKISEATAKLQKHSVIPLDEKMLADHTLKGLLKGLKDPYADYLSAEELGRVDSQLKGILTGIGVQLKIVDQRPVVLSPLEDSPALKAGMRPGDAIDAIDGKATRGLTMDEVVKRMLGPSGSMVKLKVIQADGTVKEISLTRKEIRWRSVAGFRRGKDGQWQFLLDPEHKIGYLRIQQFSSRTAAEVQETVQNLQQQGLKGLIIDLRFCPGGLLGQAIEVCKVFLDKGVILNTKGPAKAEKTWKADGKAPFADLPLVVLINDQTASAGEIVAGALRDHERAVLLGTRTFGKGSVMAIVKLEAGGALKVTTAYHYLPSGRNIQKRPGKKSWGVDPSDGFYIPLSGPQTEALQKDAWKRALLGLQQEDRPKGAGRLTAKIIEEQHADPQLAAALRTMVAKLTGGEFIKVGKDNALLLDHVLRIEEMRQRREQLLQNLKTLEREIADLQQVVGKESPNK